jgi:hypothetical protein
MMQMGVVFGAVLILVSVVDISMTVLHVQAESPLSNAANRLVWRLLKGVTAPLPRRLRDEVLAWGLPIMVGAGLGLWIVLYVVGFGLVYLPMLGDPALFSGTNRPVGASLEDATYFSAVTFFTLGYGDVVPVHPVPRLLAIVEAASGLLAIALTVAYLLAVYPFIAREQALATGRTSRSKERTHSQNGSGSSKSTARLPRLPFPAVDRERLRGADGVVRLIELRLLLGHRQPHHEEHE